MLTTIVSFILVLGFLVFIHELGHYWVARRNGIVVEEFGFGYPPRLVKLFTYDGTDFTINALPLGGFARMKGEDAGDISTGSFNGASRRGRAATLVAGPLMNAVLAALLFAGSFMAGFPAAAAHPRIDGVAAGSAAEALGLQVGDIVIDAAGVPVQVSLLPNDVATPIATQPKEGAEAVLRVSRNREIVRLPFSDYQAALAAVRATDYFPVLGTQVGAVAPDSPAEAAGLQSGDLIYSVNDQVVTYEDPLNVIVRENLDSPVTIALLRGDQWVTASATPRSAPPEGQGALGVQINGVSELATMPFHIALWEGVKATGEYAMLVLQLPAMLISGAISPEQAQFSGPIGIAQMVGDAASATINTGLWFPILRLSAVLSAALAITNLLPLPALDGGRLLFILVEAIRGRRVSPEREGLIHMIGFMVLLGLMLVITVRDITAGTQSIDWMTLLGQ